MTAGSNAQTWLALLVGGLLVAVIALGWFVYDRTHGVPQPPNQISVDLVPKVPMPQGPKIPNPPIPKPQ